MYYSIAILRFTRMRTKAKIASKKTINVIYYNWLLEMAKKLENLKVVFTFTREKEIRLTSDHPRINYRPGRFFKDLDGNKERTLLKYHGNVESAFNPICGSSALINGIVKLDTGEIVLGRGIYYARSVGNRRRTTSKN